MVGAKTRKTAPQREAHRKVFEAAAKALQEAAARVSPELFRDTSKLMVLTPSGVQAFDDLVRVGPGPDRPRVHDSAMVAL